MPSAVCARSVSKSYRLSSRPFERLRELWTKRTHSRSFEALRNVSFDLPFGGSLALVGENGAGKSTLLKLIAGVSQPSSGELHVAGRVGALLELGSGFHPEFTGRQNAELAAALHGLSPRQIRAKLPAILNWAELGDFVDRPLRQYSTGMAMRLGFSIAVHLEPEILVVDEALAVGDGYFQKKCLDRILEFQRRGGTLIFCSHALYYVSTLCEEALWLREGEVAALGPAQEVVRRYEEYLLARKKSELLQDRGKTSPRPPSPARLCDLRVLHEGPPDQPLPPGARIRIQLDWESEDPALPVHVAIGLDREPDRLPVAAFATHYDGLPPLASLGCSSLELELPALPFVQGSFAVIAFLLDESGLHVFDRRELPGGFRIEAPRFHPGLVEVPHRWLTPAAATKENVLEAGSVPRGI